jgi:hypothetical protein
MPAKPNPSTIGRDAVAVILAVGISTALNVMVLATLYVAIAGNSDVSGGLSENATQVLTGWGGGIIGILGAVFGYRAGAQQERTRQRDAEAAEAVEEDVDE